MAEMKTLNGYEVVDGKAREDILNLQADISNPPLTQVKSLPIGTLVDGCQADTKFQAMSVGTASIGAMTADTVDYLFGTQSLKFEDCIQMNGLSIDPTKEQLRIRFKVNSIDFDAANNKYGYLAVYAADSSSFSEFVAWKIFHSSPSEENKSIKTGEWHELVLPWSGVEDVSRLDGLTTVGTIRIRFMDGHGCANVQSVMTQPLEPKGVVSITFDDGLITQYTKAAPILASRGIAATAYIIPSVVGQNENAVTEEQLRALKNVYGWDIESHWEWNMHEMSEEEASAKFYETKKWLQDRGLGHGDHFAYPGGAHSETTMKVAQKYFTTARTIDKTVIKGIESTFISAPHQLGAVSGVGNNAGGSKIADVKALVDNVAQYGGWLILVFHSIGDTATSMYCKESDFIDLIDYIVASGVDIKTVADVVR